MSVSINGQPSRDRLEHVLVSIRGKGVRLWSENGQLRYKGPKDALTQEELEFLRASKDRIVELLDATRSSGPAELRVVGGSWINRAPLAFSQLARWNLYELNERRPMRTIASATRLHGRVNADALRRSVAAIVRRHDALRTRIVACDGVPMQEIAESGACELEEEDLTSAPEDCREAEVNRAIDRLVLEPVDLAKDPLLRVQLLKLSDAEYVLLVAMEHMISDMFSMGILLRELFVTYTQESAGRALPLPRVPVQFSDYALWQANAQKSWNEQHGAYWAERLAGCGRLRFPSDQTLPVTGVGWGTVPLLIGKKVKAELREWCRHRRTTPVMSVFTAYVGLVLRWCGAAEAVIQYQSDGRISPTVENTIGFFASALYLRIGLSEKDTFVDLMARVTEEYCRAFQHADFSYIATQMPPPEFTRNSIFNWIPQSSEENPTKLGEPENAIERSAIPLAHLRSSATEVDHEPSILLFDRDDEIAGCVYFPVNRFSVEAMERFARAFLSLVAGMLKDPEECVGNTVVM